MAVGSQTRDRRGRCARLGGRSVRVMSGIVSYGAYLPYWRLQRGAIGQRSAAAGARAPAASPATTRTRPRWASRPARIALARGARRATTRDVVAFATTAPAYPDKTNATAIHAALGLPDDVPARRRRRRGPLGVGAVVMAPGAARRPGRRCPTSAPACRAAADEAGGGDAAVALLFGDERDVIAEVDRRRRGDRRVPRPLARARRAVLEAVGGALRRARLRAARRAGRHRRAEERRASPPTTSTTSSSPGSHARAVKAAAQGASARGPRRSSTT